MPTDTQLSNLKINKLTHAQYQSATKGDEFYIKQDRDGIFFNGKGVELPPGLVAPFAGSVAPAGWLICDGSAISRTTYKALFDVIGTTYGAGDGSSTFNLPNSTNTRSLGIPDYSSHIVLGNNQTAVQAQYDMIIQWFSAYYSARVIVADTEQHCNSTDGTSIDLYCCGGAINMGTYEGQWGQVLCPKGCWYRWQELGNGSRFIGIPLKETEFTNNYIIKF